MFQAVQKKWGRALLWGLTLTFYFGHLTPLGAELRPENFPGPLSGLSEEKTAQTIVPMSGAEVSRSASTREYRVRTGDTLHKIARNFQVDWRRLAEKNALPNPDRLKAGQVLWIPTGVEPESVPEGYVDYAWPVLGRITSHYGLRETGFHYGLDIAAPIGTPICAADAGQVSFVGWQNGYGNVVILEHKGGHRSLYAHASRMLVQPGEKVAVGQSIAEIGNTGRSTGPHLHFELVLKGRPVNPIPYLW